MVSFNLKEFEKLLSTAQKAKDHFLQYNESSLV